MLYNHWRCEMRTLNRSAIAVAVFLFLVGLGFALADLQTQADVSSCAMMAGFAASYINPNRTVKGAAFWTVLIAFTLVSLGFCRYCFGALRWDIGLICSVGVFLLASYVRTVPQSGIESDEDNLVTAEKED